MEVVIIAIIAAPTNGMIQAVITIHNPWNGVIHENRKDNNPAAVMTTIPTNHNATTVLIQYKPNCLIAIIGLLNSTD